AGLTSVDPLSFVDKVPYPARINKYQKTTGMPDALVSGTGTIDTIPVSIAVMDFRFSAASMGSVVGEKITRAIERATQEKRGLLIVSASGGARMQEGVFSLMQMAKTSAALVKQAEAGLPFISILTHPTTGGVTASFATLGDLIIAEPGAQICFAGPRVIKDTTKQDLPEGFQTAEFLLEHGLIDQIVDRRKMRERISGFLKALCPAQATA
ncbi:MAG: acetyl-CoA carboxylase carboxyltransferase subunit beta, partial [Verrucomicrobiota bacterium]